MIIFINGLFYTGLHFFQLHSAKSVELAMASTSLENQITTTTENPGDVTNAGTGDIDPVILRCNQTLKLETAIEILNNTDQYKVINKVPENPKGGDTYLLIPAPNDDGKTFFVQ